MYIYKTGYIYVTAVNIKKSHLFLHTDIFRNCIPSSVYVCVSKIHVENLVYTFSNEPFHTQHYRIWHIGNKSLCESSVKKRFQ